jgi:RNA polymerase sigma-70 factor, ECF subfamily
MKAARARLSLVAGASSRDLSDVELATALAGAEDWAVVEAWRRFAPMVLTTAERALGSSAEAEDLTQEVFYRLVGTAKSLRDPTRLRSFVYSIAIRALRSELRYRRVRAWLSFQNPDTLVDLRHCTLDFESRQLLERFYALLNRLSARDRLVFLLRRVDGMTIEEIAAAMDISLSTVKRAMAHASDRLSRWVEADPNLAHLVDGNLPGVWRS